MVSCSTSEPKKADTYSAGEANTELQKAFTQSYDAINVADSAIFALSMDRVYSLDLERLLTGSGKVIVFESELGDVRQTDRDTVAVFVPNLAMGLEVYWALKVPSSQLDSLLKLPRARYLSSVLVAARIDSVYRPLFSVKAEDIGDEYPTIRVEDAEHFIVYGELLGFRPIR